MGDNSNYKFVFLISVVLKVLEGRKSPNLGIGIGRKIIASPLSKILSVSKNSNGVWV
jgi:hypothetical protein